jgi:hypothetical protein
MGKTTQVLSIDAAKGKFDGKYVRSGTDTFGDFQRIARSMRAPNYTSLGLKSKERVCDIIYSWKGDIDIDVRLQGCGRVDDPLNWYRIKRLCQCVITGMDSDKETIIDPDDDGETMISVDMKTHHDPLMIRRLSAKVITFYSQEIFANYDYSDVVVGAGPDCGYYVPAANGLYSMSMLAYWDSNNEASIGTALLPANIISISSNENVVVVVLSSGAVFWSNDYGKTFFESISMNGLSGFTSAKVVSVLSYSNILLGYDNLGVCGMCRSSDGGRTFYEADPYGAIDTTPVAICYQDDNLSYVLCSDSNVAMSEDGGESYMKMSNSPVGYPKDMVLMDNILIVGGFDGTGAPVIYGSDDNGCTWRELAKFNGSIFVGSFAINPYVKLSSCGCGVVAASITYNDNNGLQHSQIYRNVNWAAPNCWELLWEDYAAYSNPNGMFVVTDIDCSCLNDIMAVGRIQGLDPLYFGIRFYSEEAMYGQKWS